MPTRSGCPVAVRRTLPQRQLPVKWVMLRSLRQEALSPTNQTPFRTAAAIVFLASPTDGPSSGTIAAEALDNRKKTAAVSAARSKATKEKRAKKKDRQQVSAL